MSLIVQKLWPSSTSPPAWFLLKFIFPSPTGLRLSINGSAMCRFKDALDDTFFKRDATFSGRESYVTTTMYLFGSSSADLKDFKAGTFTYPFWYKIPHKIPSSVNAKYGKIRYYVEVSLQTWEFDIYSKTSFTIIRFEDLSSRLDLMVPVSDETVSSFCCWSCKTKPLNLHASIPYSGYVPGQCIRVTIKIDNHCGFDVFRTVIFLKKVFTFVSQKPEKHSWHEMKTLQKTVTEGAKNGKEVKISGIMEVPAFTLPTNDQLSSVVKVSYLIQVSLDVVGFIRSPKVKLPIVIGSKPLRFDYKKFSWICSSVYPTIEIFTDAAIFTWQNYCLTRSEIIILKTGFNGYKMCRAFQLI